jgi:PIN domain nuclease of toxin-antitoxin system
VKLLLDTCVVIWFFAGSPRINGKLKDTLTDPQHDLLMSDVSVLEVVIKHSLGKFALPRPPSKLIPVLALKHQVEALPLNIIAIYELERLPWHHRDPFDRLLIAQALTEGCVLVTPDPLIRQYKVQTVW